MWWCMCGGRRTTFDNRSSPSTKSSCTGFRLSVSRPGLVFQSVSPVLCKQRRGLSRMWPFSGWGSYGQYNRPQHPSAEGFGLLYMINANVFITEGMWWKRGLDSIWLFSVVVGLALILPCLTRHLKLRTTSASWPSSSTFQVPGWDVLPHHTWTNIFHLTGIPNIDICGAILEVKSTRLQRKWMG